MKPEDVKFILPDDFRRLLAAAKSGSKFSLRDRNYLLFCLAGNLGLRVSEVVELRIEHFHFEQPSRPFVRIATKKKRRAEFDDLALDARLAKLVRSYISSLGAKATLRARRSYDDEERRPRSKLCLFAGQSSAWKPMTERAAQLAFKEAARMAKLDPRVSFHSLRHFRGTQLWAATHDPLVVKRFLRHDSMSSTSVYIHMTRDEEAKINSRVGAIT